MGMLGGFGDQRVNARCVSCVWRVWLGLEGELEREVLDEHDSPQWYDIVHFEHKLSWLCFGLPQKASSQWR